MGTSVDLHAGERIVRAYLVNVGFGSCYIAYDTFYEARNFSHDISLVKSLPQISFEDCGDSLPSLVVPVHRN